MKKAKPKIVGLNVARAIAIIGMIIVNFTLVLGTEGPEWLQSFNNFFKGKAAATFVVLAGLGLGLMSKSAEETNQGQALQWKVFKRALFLFVIGISYYFIWPADILHYYGVYMLFAIPFLIWPSAYALRLAGILIIAFPILLFNFNYEIGWDWETLDYLDFWTLNGFFRNLFFNGFHPFIPWMAFLLIGIWVGRQDLYDETFIIALFQRGLALFITIQVLSPFAVNKAVELLGFSPESAELVFGTGSMPPNPMYMLNGIGIAFTIIAGSIIWAWRRKEQKAIKVLDASGRLALSFYVFHVVVGMSLPIYFTDWNYGEFPLYFSLPYAIVFSALCLIIGHLYFKRWKRGPLEWLMRRITG